MATPCAGCEARQSEIAFLRKQLESLQGALVAGGGVRAQAAAAEPSPAAPGPFQPMSILDQSGKAWVVLGDKVIEPEKFTALMAEAKYLTQDGSAVPHEEYAAAMTKLDNMIAGG